MTLDEFVKAFAEELDDTPIDEITPSTVYRELDEWTSLTALSIISMVDDREEKALTGADLRSCKTIEELYQLIQSK
jgi:acyl carrier protein